MIVSRDQFWSLDMLTLRPSNQAPSFADGSSYSVFSGRNAIYLSLKMLGVPPQSEILVPSFICRAAVDPLLSFGVNVSFYPVSRRCEVDPADLERRIGPATRAVLVVHYFGFPQPMQSIRELCDTKGVRLIEDCAHVLAGVVNGKPMGSFGDAAVFSWRKFLPVYDGGELVLNRAPQNESIRLQNESLLFSVKAAANMAGSRLGQSNHGLPGLGYRGVRAGGLLYKRLIGRRVADSPMMQAEPTSVSFDIRTVRWPMSRLSRWTKRYSNISGIVAGRRRNYEILQNELSDAPVDFLFSGLSPEMCPWVFPVLFRNVPDAHVLLRRRGIPAVTWGGVRHPQIPSGVFHDAEFLYQNLVFLPIHQCLRQQDLTAIVRVVRSVSAK
jgi:dTDP-4-amino-4,6-dideoxygalactose transaminase